MGGGNRKKTKKKKTKVQEAAAKRHENFKKTGVQTFGGTRKNYSKKEAEKIGTLGKVGNETSSQAFSRITGGAANPLNRAPSTEGVKVGPIKKEFATPLGGVDYSKFAAPKVNYNFNQRPKSDISFSEAVRGGARFNQAGRNELSGGKDVAMLPGDAGSKLGIAIGSGIVGGATFLKNKVQDAAENLRRINEEKMEGLGDQSSIYSSPGTLLSGSNLQGLAPKTVVGSEVGFDRDSFNQALEGNYDPDTTAGGLNIGNNFQLSAEQGDRLARALTDGPSPRMLSEGGDLRFSDMYEAAGPGANMAKGINFVKNKIPLVKMLPDMKINSVAEEAQRRYLGFNPNLPSNVLKQQGRKKGGGGARLPVAAPTPEEILLPEETAAQTTPVYQQVAGQTGVDPNRLLQIQQDAYQQAFNPSYNPMFRFFDQRRGARKGAFRKAFRVRKD